MAAVPLMRAAVTMISTTAAIAASAARGIIHARTEIVADPCRVGRLRLRAFDG
jgi:hypothetical protein